MVGEHVIAIQAIEHLSVVLASLAGRRLENQLLLDPDGVLRVVVPGRDLAYYLDLACGQVRRYGRAEPRVDRALLRILHSTGLPGRRWPVRSLVAQQVRLVLADAERAIAQPADFVPVREHAERVLREIG
jgi:uncharacterized membrane protein